MKKVFLLAVFFHSLNCKAQSPLINALPMEYNPSFAGSSGTPRLASNNYLRGGYFTSGLSYDQFFSKIRTGVGLTLDYSKYNGFSNPYPNYFSSSYWLNNLVGGIAISPKFSINGRYTIAPSIQGLFGSNEHYFNGKLHGNSLKIKASILFNTKRFYIGYAVGLLNKMYGDTKYVYDYTGGFFNSTDSSTEPLTPHKRLYKIPFSSNLQLGFTTQKNDDVKFSYNPLIVLYIGRNSNYYTSTHYASNSIASILLPNLRNLVMNHNFRYKHILAGLIIGNGGTGLMAGFQNKNIKLTYVQYGSRYFGYTGQFSFKYLFNSEPKKRTPISSYQ